MSKPAEATHPPPHFPAAAEQVTVITDQILAWHYCLIPRPLTLGATGGGWPREETAGWLSLLGIYRYR